MARLPLSISSFRWNGIVRTISRTTTYMTAGTCRSISRRLSTGINRASARHRFNNGFKFFPVHHPARKPRPYASWDENFQLLLEYREKNGDCLVPKIYVTGSGVKLGNWVDKQRQEYRLLKEEGMKSSMTEERIERLESIGFVWNKFRLLWDLQFELLKQYYKENGPCRVPENFVKGGIPLGKWARNQWLACKKQGDREPGSEMQYRIGKLRSLNFPFPKEVHSGKSNSEMPRAAPPKTRDVTASNPAAYLPAPHDAAAAIGSLPIEGNGVDFWGPLLLLPRPTETERIILVNVRGVPLRSIDRYNLLMKLRKLDGTMYGIVETHLDSTHHKSLVELTLQKVWPCPFMEMADSKESITDGVQRKYGGVMQFITGSACQFVQESIKDKDFGRWAAHILLHSNGRKSVIYTCYRVSQKNPEKAGPATACKQQHRQGLESDPDFNPRKQFLVDLSTEIQSKRKEGYEVLVMGDFNTPINDPELQKFRQDCKLIDLHEPYISNPSQSTTPSTYKHGSTKIDHIFATPFFLDSMQRGGMILSWDLSIADHRILVIDLCQTKLSLLPQPMSTWGKYRQRLALLLWPTLSRWSQG